MKKLAICLLVLSGCSSAPIGAPEGVTFAEYPWAVYSKEKDAELVDEGMTAHQVNSTRVKHFQDANGFDILGRSVVAHANTTGVISYRLEPGLFQRCEFRDGIVERMEFVRLKKERR